jgi:hypothetical protein
VQVHEKWRAGYELTHKLTSTEHAVFMAILFHTNAKLQCFPAYPTLAKYTRQDIKTVRRAVAGLEEKGLLAVSKGKNRSNRYVILDGVLGVPKAVPQVVPKTVPDPSIEQDNAKDKPKTKTKPKLIFGRPACTACAKHPSSTAEPGKCWNCIREDKRVEQVLSR